MELKASALDISEINSVSMIEERYPLDQVVPMVQLKDENFEVPITQKISGLSHEYLIRSEEVILEVN